MKLSLDEVICYFGHDGSEIIHPELPDPHGRRCFTEHELQIAAWKLGCNLLPFPEFHPEFEEMYATFDGLLSGEYDGVRAGHIVTKLDGWLYDPRFLDAEEPKGFPFMTLKRKVFFAWMNP